MVSIGQSRTGGGEARLPLVQKPRSTSRSVRLQEELERMMQLRNQCGEGDFSGLVRRAPCECGKGEGDDARTVAYSLLWY